MLERCLGDIAPYVDGIFITFTHKKGEEPFDFSKNFHFTNTHGTRLMFSSFEWCNDFSAARNFSFQQVTKDYDYIMWCDADDRWRGVEKLRATINNNPTIDAFAFWYMYEFDEFKQPIVLHKKTMIIRNDDCATWKGALHEDLMPNRSLEVKLVEGIDRMHFPGENHKQEVSQRNIEISSKEAELNPEDPRNFFNLGNSYIGASRFEDAKVALEKFVALSGSDDERYIAYLRLASTYNALGNIEQTITTLRIAIGLKPEHPDAYHQLGYLFFDNDNVDQAEFYLLQGLIKKPQQHDIIVYNPRDYDYNPLFALSKVYFKKNRPDLALPLLEGCLQVNPQNPRLGELIVEMRAETKRLEDVITAVKGLEGVTDRRKIKRELAKIPADLQSHPMVCSIRNQWFIRETSTGKDITYYCGMTTHVWNPEMAKTKGIGGSEEAVINLAKEWQKAGYNVTVYNNCGVEEMTCDGVVYKPFWQYNYRDKTDYTIIWRHPKLLDYELNGKLFVDLHDVISPGEFNEKRLEKVDKIFVKTKFHRSLLPNVPDEKIAIIPNGMDFELFSQTGIEKNQFLMVNTSSPDRSLDVLPKLFKMVKEEVPEARLKWAYGWEIFDNSFSTNKDMMAWKRDTVRAMEEAGIENMGRLSQKECAKLYLEGNILAYPTEFAEIDCITVKKAQACGCMPITTDFGALDESVKHGVKVHSEKTKDNWNRPYQFSFGLEDEEAQKKWVKSVIRHLKMPIEHREEMMEWAHSFEWPKISAEWLKVIA